MKSWRPHPKDIQNDAVEKRYIVQARNFWYLFLHPRRLLGGGFKYFLFSPLPGEMIQFD